jgi:hypothetical protein
MNGEGSTAARSELSLFNHACQLNGLRRIRLSFRPFFHLPQLHVHITHFSYPLPIRDQEGQKIAKRMRSYESTDAVGRRQIGLFLYKDSRIEWNISCSNFQTPLLSALNAYYSWR